MILRFRIAFPSRYPTVPPLVTFSTEIFHPLVTPWTTYTHTTGAIDDDTVSATDDERLPPGGFTLRHGFPHWFARNQKSAASSRDPSTSGASGLLKSCVDTPVAEVLNYIRSTFDDEEVLNSIPLEAAANSGAYHAWQCRKTYDGGAEPLFRRQVKDVSDTGARRPGQWSWEGVWEERVKRGMQASLSEAVLFGSGGDDMVSSVSSEIIECSGVHSVALNLTTTSCRFVSRTTMRNLRRNSCEIWQGRKLQAMCEVASCSRRAYPAPDDKRLLPLPRIFNIQSPFSVECAVNWLTL